MTVRMQVEVTGVVQGVGFRPAVARIAARRGLTGSVSNESGVVRCEFEGAADAVAAAIAEVGAGPTPLSRVDAVVTAELQCRNDSGFVIATSRAGGAARTIIPSDVATCPNCLAELHDPGNRRYGHPFITCTDCGPRYTVITDLPYDRDATTMAAFTMCEACRREYTDPTDRRYHAETIACPDCGPRLEFRGIAGRPVPGHMPGDDPITAAATALCAGKIVAIKGIGGYHLACRADLDEPVELLRSRKGRPDKPFAIMVGGLDEAARLVELDHAARQALAAPTAPVVIAPRNAGSRAAGSLAADAVAPRLADLGVMIAYTPIHHLLFDRLGPLPLVMTSANTSGSPILFRDSDIDDRLDGIADAVLTHDRRIVVPCEDSVVRVDGDTTDGDTTDGDTTDGDTADGAAIIPIRRSRGYAPMPVTGVASPVPLVATGGDLKTTFCLLGRDGHAHMSSHLGDMSDPRTQRSFTDALDHLQQMTAVTAAAIACDMHPRYATTAWAHRAAGGREVIEVQHHHAHAVSLLAEHGLLGTPAVVLTFDGTGYGTDGVVWGGEFLALGTDPSVFTRVAHLAEFALPGGENAVREPSRIALDLLWRSGIGGLDDLHPATTVGDLGLRIIAQQRAKGLGCPTTTSMGRLFDGVSALLGICAHVTYEGQAAIELEACARHGVPDSAALDRMAIDQEPTPGTLDHRHIIAHLSAGLRAGRGRADLAATFQQWVIDASVRVATDAAHTLGINTVGLTGGVFANTALRRGIGATLEQRGLWVLTHATVPPNDGGLALGQACVAAATLAARAERPTSRGEE
ncbi:carbamoyltransferase HypF [Gordonia rhizosphera]|uniref:Carbamoyltransferase n=1 Tax=Gordonia rhizosphera NBRC 16068 TaxID=1108045 RepID=K6V5K1_9ACTN|nr:carbamoyltransferase HypF [Gordonia rhizosphera]GAB91528.1 NiFe-hydrogenase maturation protein HypF [Gordonia rhizosphera NBRC 16068]